jgi:hypothetical protein
MLTESQEDQDPAKDS